MRKLVPIGTVLVMLIASLANAHLHLGYDNVSVTPMEVLPGDAVDLDFDYTIWHYEPSSPECPWEVWLDGTPDTRDGLLLASGSNWHGGYTENETYHVDADGLTIPLTTTLGMHTIKIASAAAIDYDGGGYYWSTIEFTYVSIEVIPLEVDIDIKPGSCPNAFNAKNNGVIPVAIVHTEDFDVTTVDPATITLEGVSPIYWALEDTTEPFEELDDCVTCFEAPEPIYDGDLLVSEYTGDGLPDLILHFDVQELAAAIGEADRDECLDLTLSGNNLDGVPIEGVDYIIVKTKIKD